MRESWSQQARMGWARRAATHAVLSYEQALITRDEPKARAAAERLVGVLDELSEEGIGEHAQRELLASVADELRPEIASYGQLIAQLQRPA